MTYQLPIDVMTKPKDNKDNNNSGKTANKYNNGYNKCKIDKTEIITILKTTRASNQEPATEKARER